MQRARDRLASLDVRREAPERGVVVHEAFHELYRYRTGVKASGSGVSWAPERQRK